MAKTREIEGWVFKNAAEGVTEGKRTSIGMFMHDLDVDGATVERCKAKLIIELPEKKIELTESDIDKAFNSIRYKEEFQENGEPLLCAFTVRHLKQKLFGGTNDN